MARSRQAARLIVFDPADRVLLFQLRNRENGNTWWATPGGGLETGETERDAAVRELREETGLEASSVEGPVYDSDHWFRSGPELIHQRERFFVARVDSAEVDRSGLDEVEGDTIVGSRWWSLLDLDTSLERIYPETLGVIARAALRGRAVPGGKPASIAEAHTGRHLAEVRRLFREYEQFLGVDLCFQDFDGEIVGLPGAYAPPKGSLLVAHAAREPVGVAALREFEPGIAELKRVYVRDAYRGRGLGRRLTGRLIGTARAAGYPQLRLDTLAKLVEARALYRDFGFKEIAPYRENPLDQPVFMELAL